MSGNYGDGVPGFLYLRKYEDPGSPKLGVPISLGGTQKLQVKSAIHVSRIASFIM